MFKNLTTIQSLMATFASFITAYIILICVYTFIPEQAIFISFLILILTLVLNYLLHKEIVNKIKELTNSKQKLQKEKESLEKKIKNDSTFLKELSRDIRTPLNSIVGFSTLLEKSNLNQKDKEQVEIIHKSANSLLDTINEISDISKEEKSLEKEDLVNSKELYKGKVLVAEDNTSNQLLIKLILEELGIEIKLVDNGKKAFEEYQKESFDLVLMDINMPIMDGLEALKNIRKYEDEIKTYTPIIALTANSIKGDKEKYLKEGMDDYISKPFQKTSLIRILDVYLNKELEEKKDENFISKDKLDINNIAEKLGVEQNVAKMIVNKFKSTIFKDLDEFEKIIEKKDFEEISQKAHYIKNSCLNVSLNEVCSLLYELERAKEMEEKNIKLNFNLIKQIITAIVYKKD